MAPRRAYAGAVARVEVVLGIAITVLWIYSIVNCALTPESQVRGLPKFAWLILIVLLPLLGSVLWLGVGRTAGPPRLPRRAPAAPPAAAGPGGYAAMTHDDRIRQMEEDLRRLERETEDPGQNPDRA